MDCHCTKAAKLCKDRTIFYRQMQIMPKSAAFCYEMDRFYPIGRGKWNLLLLLEAKFVVKSEYPVIFFPNAAESRKNVLHIRAFDSIKQEKGSVKLSL